MIKNKQMSIKFELKDDHNPLWLSDGNNYCFPIFILNGVVVAASKLSDGMLRVVLRQHGRDPIALKGRIPPAASDAVIGVELFWRDRGAAMRVEVKGGFGAEGAQRPKAAPRDAWSGNVVALDDFRPDPRPALSERG